MQPLDINFLKFLPIVLLSALRNGVNKKNEKSHLSSIKMKNNHWIDMPDGKILKHTLILYIPTPLPFPSNHPSYYQLNYYIDYFFTKVFLFAIDTIWEFENCAFILRITPKGAEIFRHKKKEIKYKKGKNLIFTHQNRFVTFYLLFKFSIIFYSIFFCWLFILWSIFTYTLSIWYIFYFY